MFLIMFFLLVGFFIVSQNNLALKNTESVNTFFSSYGNWLYDLFESSRGIIGYFVKMEWLPEQGDVFLG